MIEKDFDVVVIGNAGIDTNVFLAGEDIDFTVEANFTENLDTIGGAGGYSCRGFARLGKKTAFIGFVGDDFCGDHIRQNLAGEGIDTRALFTDDAGTPRSVNFMYRDGRRKNFFDGKGHMRAIPDLTMCREVLSQARLAHFSIPNWARHLLAPARQAGLKIACDIQDVVHPNDPYRQDFIRFSDILFFSSVNYEDPTPLVHAFWSDNPDRIIVVGMGARGCALGARGEIRFFAPVLMEGPVVDTNGAGDGLAVGFLTAYALEGFSLEDAILRGQIAARHTCTLRGTSSGLISSDELARRFQALKGNTP